MDEGLWRNICKKHFIAELNKMDIALRTAGDVVYDTFKEVEENRIKLRYMAEWSNTSTVMGIPLEKVEEVDQTITEIPILIAYLKTVDSGSIESIHAAKEWFLANGVTSAKDYFLALAEDMEKPYRTVDGLVYETIPEATAGQERLNTAQADVLTQFGDLDLSFSTYSNKCRIESVLTFLRNEYPKDTGADYGKRGGVSQEGTVWNYVREIEAALKKYREYERICNEKASGIFGSSKIRREFERYLLS